ncbi:MAG: hypothetical protein PVH07_04740 [Chloroflexota bacterium]|jgi:hypothetical protein
MNQRDPEYDRFGPWVIEISDEDPPPPLFVPHLTRAEAPLLSLKIPRKISRREAHPGMDLYDYMVSLYEDDMVVLKRIERQVQARTISYRDVQYLSVRDELLRGTVHLGVPDGHDDLPYNTVSGDIMQRLVGIIRERYQPAPGSVPIGVEAVAATELSIYFERLLREAQGGDPAMRPVATQPDTALGALEESVPRRLFFGLVAKRLLESAHLSDGRELRIIDRGQPYAYRWQSVYGRAETWLPLANITAVDWDWGPDEAEAAPVTVTVSTRAGDLRWVFTPNNPTIGHYRRFLTAVGEVNRRG